MYIRGDIINARAIHSLSLGRRYVNKATKMADRCGRFRCLTRYFYGGRSRTTKRRCIGDALPIGGRSRASARIDVDFQANVGVAVSSDIADVAATLDVNEHAA